MSKPRIANLVYTAIGIVGLCALATFAGDLIVNDLAVRGKLEVNKKKVPDAITTNGLVLYFSFDTDESGTVTDESGNDHTGTVLGAAWTSNGISAGAYQFDGVDDIISVAYKNDLDGMSQVSFGAWFYSTNFSASKQGYIIDKGANGENDSYALIFDEAGQAADKIVGMVKTSGKSRATSTTVPSDGVWYHGFCIYNGASVTIYINGSAEHSAPRTGTVQVDTDIGVMVGGRIDSSTDFNGKIDEVRIYNRALSAEEVRNIYLNEKPGAEATGQARFHTGIKYLKAKGDLSMGIYTNTP